MGVDVCVFGATLFLHVWLSGRVHVCVCVCMCMCTGGVGMFVHEAGWLWASGWVGCGRVGGIVELRVGREGGCVLYVTVCLCGWGCACRGCGCAGVCVGGLLGVRRCMLVCICVGRCVAA